MPNIYFKYKIGDRVIINKEKSTGKVVSVIAYNCAPWRRFLVKLDGPGGRVGEEYLFVDSELKSYMPAIPRFSVGEEVMFADNNDTIGIVLQIDKDQITDEFSYKVKVKGRKSVDCDYLDELKKASICWCHEDELKKIEPKFKLNEMVKSPMGISTIAEIRENSNEYLVKVGLLLKWFKGEQLEKISQSKSVNNEEKAKIEKPPIGLMPKYIWEMRRRETIANAIARYTFANETIPKEWIEEYNELALKIVSK